MIPFKAAASCCSSLRTTGAKKYVYLTDQLGSVRDVVDASTGSLVGALDYSPYGQVQRQSGSVSPRYPYGQLLWDGNAGLSVSTTRFYDAGVGRWMSRDPIREKGGINLYGYVGGSPTMGVDPQGEYVWVIAGAGIGGTFNLISQLSRNGGDLSKIDPKELVLAAGAGALSGGLGEITAGLGVGANIIANGFGSGIISGAQTIASNAWHGQCLTKGASQAALKGAAFGGAGAAAGAAVNSITRAVDLRNFGNLPLSDKLLMRSNGLSGPFHPPGTPNWAIGGTVAGNFISNAVSNANQ